MKMKSTHGKNPKMRSPKRIGSVLSDGSIPSPSNGSPITVWDPQIKNHIDSLIKKMSPDGQPFENADVAHEIIITALKAVQVQLSRGDLKLLSRSLRELRYAFKIFRNYRGVKKVTLFGSARTQSFDPAYKLAKSLANLLTRNGYMVITGAGPGIMQAGNEGSVPGKSFGVNIRLPYEQIPNKYIANKPTYIDCRYFFTRKLVFIKETNATVIFPGGFGTLDEAFEILTLVQTGKCDPMPIIFLDKRGGKYWKDFTRFIRTNLLTKGLISPEDLNIYKVCYSAEQAWDEIIGFYSNYHSLRYVKDYLVMRFSQEITDAQLSYLNKNFKDILRGGQFMRSRPFVEEMNQPDLENLPRLVFKFNRVSNGRLRQLIDYMNK